ncbi:MAG: ATP-binding protein, partial [Acidobacteriota bacterium]
DMWEKVILNLLSNALKFTFAGTIGLSLRAVDGAAVLTVRDTGVGIPASELPFVFDRFHRVQSTRGRTQEGTGIGLALVRELCKLHGGSIDVESVVNGGTTFTLKLPFGSAHLPQERLSPGHGAAPAAVRAEAFVSEAERWFPAEKAPLASPGSVAPTARILLADDNADMRDYVARLLSDRWLVETVADGTAALALARAHPPDLVLADVMMPGLNGFELLEQLRGDARTRTVPVVFLSARAGEEARVDGLQAGADDYLAKPFSARELIARVSTHLELSRLRREAERARARMHEQFMQAPVAVCVTSGPEFLFELANPRYEDMVRRPGLAGQKLRNAFPELPDDAPVLQMLRQVYETGEVFHAEEFLVPLDRTGTGVIADAYFKFTAQALRNEQHAIDGVIIVAVDVTEQVQARQQIERQAAELDRLNRAKDEFLATLSHELRTPLTSILGWARLLRMEIGDAELRQTGLESIDQSAQVQAKVIDDVLDLSRITTGKVYVDREVVNLVGVASAALDGVQLAAAAKGIVLERHFPSDHQPVLVLGDANRLQQVVWNLLTNAIKFTPEGGIVRLEVTDSESSVSLTVADNGMGIRPDFLPHVFETFRQADNSATRNHGGLGLGLSIVRHLTELHGGRATVTSDGEGRGATFTLRFPLLKGPPVEQSMPASMAGPWSNTLDTQLMNLHGVSVLVIDDQEAVSAFFSATLQRNGAKVHTASSVQEAFRAVELEVPDVVLCDIAMPHQDGFAFLSWMLSRPTTRTVPVLAITAFGRPEDEANTLAAGFRAYVRKPVDPIALARAVAAAISSRRPEI